MKRQATRQRENARPIPLRENPDEFLCINAQKLPQEWQELPSLYAAWGTKYAGEKRKLRRAKAALKLARLLFAKKIRKNTSAYGLPKTVRPTKVWLDEVISRQPAILKATEAVEDFEFDVESVGVVLHSIRIKSDALKDLVKMHLHAWYSEGTGESDAYVDLMEESEESTKTIATPRRPTRRPRSK